MKLSTQVMNQSKICPKCGADMEKGLMLTPGAIVGVRWQKGEPNKWLNLLGNLPKVEAYGCSKCRYIENYIEEK